MMAALESFADNLEASATIDVPYEDAKITGRALAGVAGFLQQHILPETVAAENRLAEVQVRWVIDTSMSLTAALTVHAETVTDGSSCQFDLPAPPVVD